MEIIIRFDENSVADLQRAQEVLDQLVGRNRDPFECSRDQLWQVLNTGIDQLSNAAFSKNSLPRLWANGIHRIGQFVQMPKEQLWQIFLSKRGVVQSHFNGILADFDSRLHLFMTREEVLDWVAP